MRSNFKTSFFQRALRVFQLCPRFFDGEPERLHSLRYSIDRWIKAEDTKDEALP